MKDITDSKNILQSLKNGASNYVNQLQPVLSMNDESTQASRKGQFEDARKQGWITAGGLYRKLVDVHASAPGGGASGSLKLAIVNNKQPAVGVQPSPCQINVGDTSRNEDICDAMQRPFSTFKDSGCKSPGSKDDKCTVPDITFRDWSMAKDYGKADAASRFDTSTGENYPPRQQQRLVMRSIVLPFLLQVNVLAHNPCKARAIDRRLIETEMRGSTSAT